ncbi:MAG TPA: hypothetical protein VM554_00710 [Acidisarcina sp.]|nr:hypothetical protein [Acidisarcina sp.]
MANEELDYPTREQIAEFLEAHRRGGAQAIADLLRKKQGEAQDVQPQPQDATQSNS